MKKVLLCLLMVVAFIWGIVQCEEARADHWVRTGVFDVGTYLSCGVMGGEPQMCMITESDGSVKETQDIVDILNSPPLSMPDDLMQVIYYHWVNGYWIKYKNPWKFVEGTEM